MSLPRTLYCIATLDGKLTYTTFNKHILIYTRLGNAVKAVEKLNKRTRIKHYITSYIIDKG